MYHRIMNMPLQPIMNCYIDDVISPPNQPNLRTAITLSARALIKTLKYRKYGYMVTLLIDCTHGMASGKKKIPEVKMAAILKMSKYLTFNLILHMKTSSQIMQQNVFFIVMSSSFTSQCNLEVVPLHSFIDEKTLLRDNWNS